jgi:hypothetical protein
MKVVCGLLFMMYLHVNRVERVQRTFIRFALRCLGWTDLHDLPPYDDRCALLHIDTLFKRRTVDCIMFVFDILVVRVCSSSLLCMMHIIAPWYQTGGGDFLRIRFHTLFMSLLMVKRLKLVKHMTLMNVLWT